MLKKTIAGLFIAFILLWLGNTSLFARAGEDGKTKLIAHRGVHQTFDAVDVSAVGRDDCTAPYD